MADGSLRCTSANALDMACIKQAKVIGFASILTISEDTAPKRWKHHGKGKGKKRAGVVVASAGASIQLYTPVKLPLPR